MHRARHVRGAILVLSAGILGECRAGALQNPITHHPWDWYIYLHVINVYGKWLGKYTIHGSYGFYMILYDFISKRLPSPKLTASLHLNMDGWKTMFYVPFGMASW